MKVSARLVGFLTAGLCVIAIGAPVASAGTFAMSIDESQTQSGRIFRDALPSECPSKAYPGIFNAGTTYGYDTHSFVAPLTGCASFERVSSTCETNAHLIVYEGAYDPLNQEANYLGDQGSSVDGEPFFVGITAGQTYVVVVSNTSELAACEVTVNATLPGYAGPDTLIDSGPLGAINTDAAKFTFHSEPAAATVRLQCQIDGGGFNDCVSPASFTGLADGPHTVEFRSEDGLANVDETPAKRTFVVDTAAPDTIIDSGPLGTIETSEATFTFHGNPAADTVKVQCQIDGGGFSDCTSPATFTGLTLGSHTAEFRAVDAVGNADKTPAVATFRVSNCKAARAALARAKKQFMKSKKRFKKALKAKQTHKTSHNAKKRLSKAKKAKKKALRRLKAARKAATAACS